jgi:hypothetical protein
MKNAVRIFALSKEKAIWKRNWLRFKHETMPETQFSGVDELRNCSLGFKLNG